MCLRKCARDAEIRYAADAQYAFRSVDRKAIINADLNSDMMQATTMKRSSCSRIAIIFLIFLGGIVRQSKAQDKRINDDTNVVTLAFRENGVGWSNRKQLATTQIAFGVHRPRQAVGEPMADS